MVKGQVVREGNIMTHGFRCKMPDSEIQVAMLSKEEVSYAGLKR